MTDDEKYTEAPLRVVVRWAGHLVFLHVLNQGDDRRPFAITTQPRVSTNPG